MITWVSERESTVEKICASGCIRFWPSWNFPWAQLSALRFEASIGGCRSTRSSLSNSRLALTFSRWSARSIFISNIALFVTNTTIRAYPSSAHLLSYCSHTVVCLRFSHQSVVDPRAPRHSRQTTHHHSLLVLHRDQARCRMLLLGPVECCNWLWAYRCYPARCSGPHNEGNT